MFSPKPAWIRRKVKKKKKKKSPSKSDCSNKKTSVCLVKRLYFSIVQQRFALTMNKRVKVEWIGILQGSICFLFSEKWFALFYSIINHTFLRKSLKSHIQTFYLNYSTSRTYHCCKITKYTMLYNPSNNGGGKRSTPSFKQFTTLRYWVSTGKNKLHLRPFSMIVNKI